MLSYSKIATCYANKNLSSKQLTIPKTKDQANHHVALTTMLH